MGTKSGPNLDKVAFEKLRRIAPNILAATRIDGKQNDLTRALPDEVAFKLTNRCDLRCTHCYQWKEGGYHRQLAPAVMRRDLDLSIVKKVLSATKKTRSNIYLWGGEPLMYRDWEGLVDLLKKDSRWTSLCTNGTLIKKRIDSLIRISERLEVSISIDGFENEHNAMRGKGAFQKTISGLSLLVEKKRAGEFKGEITVNCVISDSMISRLYEFMVFLEQKGVETVYLSFPWFLSEEACKNMDRHYIENFSWEIDGGKPSWYSYDFKIDQNLIDTIIAEIDSVNNREWITKIRYNPDLDVKDIHTFISGSDKPAQNKSRCQSIHTRMDIFPSGEVVSCKFFPEFSVGNLKDKAVEEVWKGSRFEKVRETLSKCGLMPVCAKCNLLYSRGG